jgi:hypothetical protein
MLANKNLHKEDFFVGSVKKHKKEESREKLFGAPEIVVFIQVAKIVIFS